MYAQLGDIIFQAMFGPDQYDDTEEMEFAQIPLINRKPRLQPIGEKLQEINIGISLSTAFCTPEVELQKIRDKKSNVEVLPFIWGNGDVEGDFVIRAIKKTVNSLSPDGNFRLIYLQLTLVEYYNPDKLGSLKKLAVKNAFATSLDAPTPQNVIIEDPSPAVSVTKDLGNADAHVNNANSKMDYAVTKASTYTDPIDKAQLFVTQAKIDSYQLRKLIRNTKTLLNSIGVKLAATPALTALAVNMSTHLTAAQSAVDAAQTVADGYDSLPDPVSDLTDANTVITSMNNTTTATSNLKSALSNLKISAQPLAIVSATRKDL